MLQPWVWAMLVPFLFLICVPPPHSLVHDVQDVQKEGEEEDEGMDAAEDEEASGGGEKDGSEGLQASVLHFLVCSLTQPALSQSSK